MNNHQFIYFGYLNIINKYIYALIERNLFYHYGVRS